MSVPIRADAAIGGAAAKRRTRAHFGHEADGQSRVATGSPAAVGGAGALPDRSSDARESTRGRTLLVRLSPDCPTRPVDWRWQKAGLLLDLGLRRLRRRDDAPTREARRFLAALRRCRGDAHRRRLNERMPGVAAAHALSTDPPARRWAVEARLLGGEPPAAIASKEGTTVEAVTRYEALVFNVSDRLGNRGYIAHAAIGQAAHPGPGVEGLGTFWRLLGFHGGPAILDLANAAGPASATAADWEVTRAALTRLRLALTPLAPARASRRRSPPGGSAQIPRLSASGRRRGRRSADPPPPGVPIEPAEPTDPPGDAGPETRSRARARGAGRAGPCEVGDGSRTR